jgi:hypothetical protein
MWLSSRGGRRVLLGLVVTEHGVGDVGAPSCECDECGVGVAGHQGIHRRRRVQWPASGPQHSGATRRFHYRAGQVNILSAPTLLAIDVDITSQQLTDAVIHVPDRVVMLGCEANVGSVGGTLVEGWNTDEPSELGIQVFNRMSLVRADIHGGVGRLAQEVTRTGRCPIAASEDGYPPGASGRLLKVMVRPSVLSRMPGPVSTSALCAEHIQYSQAPHGVGFPALITPSSSQPTTTHSFTRPGFLV